MKPLSKLSRYTIILILFIATACSPTVTGVPSGEIPTIAPSSTLAPSNTPLPANTPAPTHTPSPTDTLTLIPTNTPTIASTNTPTPKITNVPTSLPSTSGEIYYLSPTGNDSNSGLTENSPWATFNHAWQFLYPGDTLVLLDGAYYQMLRPNVRNGRAGKPITIRAKNDGKVIIDGQNQRKPVLIGNCWTGTPGCNVAPGESPVGNYFVVEGIVAKNSSGSVWSIDGGNNNILRRVSGYDANTDENEHVFSVWASNNLLEDIVAAGTGRKMVLIYGGGNNIVRRAFAMWKSYDGRNFLQCWPWGDGIEIYNSSNNIIENSIAYGRIPMYMISMLAQGQNSDNNKILGTMGIMSGMDYDMTPMRWTVRPQPTIYTCVSDLTQGGPRAGFSIYEASGALHNNLWQDIFSWGNASWAFTWITDQGIYRGFGGSPSTANNTIDHATFFNNGLDNMDGPWPGQFGGLNTDVLQATMARFSSITNSRIDKIFIDWPDYPNGPRNLTSMNGEGARLTYRYINGVLMDGTNGQPAQPLWPWPMEDRIKAELELSVTNLITNIMGVAP